MSEQTHAHEVMNMMIEEKIAHTKESLCKKIIERFGEDARFYACSADNMDSKQLVTFLEEKGKFIPSSDNSFHVNPETMCSHE